MGDSGQPSTAEAFRQYHDARDRLISGYWTEYARKLSDSIENDFLESIQCPEVA